MDADVSAAFTLSVVPLVQTFVTAYGTVAVLCDALVEAGEVALFTAVVAVPYVLAGETAVDTGAAREVVIFTYLAADSTYAVGVSVVAGISALSTVAVYPLVLTLGRGRHRAADEIELEDHTVVHEEAVLFEGYLFIVPIYGHPVCTGCYGFLVGGAEIFTDKFAESDLVANLVFVFLISNENIISGEQLAADMAVYVVAVVVLTDLFTQGTYTVYPFVVALGRYNSLHTADKTGVFVSGDKIVLTYRATRRAYALIPYVYANVGLMIFHLAAYGAVVVFKAVCAYETAVYAYAVPPYMIVVILGILNLFLVTYGTVAVNIVVLTDNIAEGAGTVPIGVKAVLADLFAYKTYALFPFVLAGEVAGYTRAILEFMDTAYKTLYAAAVYPYVLTFLGNYGVGEITAVFTAAVLDEVVVTLGLTDTAVATAVECPEVLTLRGICVEDVELDDLC